VRSNVDDAGRTVSFGRWPTPDVVTFMPEGNTAAARAKYDATIESLGEMQKAGWIELEVNAAKRGRPEARRAAAARCTEAGREALRLLGE
jgi:hypothetical protein